MRLRLSAFAAAAFSFLVRAAFWPGVSCFPSRSFLFYFRYLLDPVSIVIVRVQVPAFYDFNFICHAKQNITALIWKRRYDKPMRLPPAADMPAGGTPAERLDFAFRKVLTVPKEAILKQEAKEKRTRRRNVLAKRLNDNG
jgi:hypothetical protein